MKTLRYCCINVSAFMLCCALWSCANQYYQPNAVIPRSRYPRVIERAKKDKLYLMLHSGINVYAITSVEMDKAKKQLTVQLDKVDSLHLSSVNNPVNQQNNSRNGEPAPLSAMHLIMTDSVSYTLDEPHTIILDKVARIEMMD